MPEKLNIKNHKDDIYTVEVNENGDCIEFDLTDITMPIRANEAFQKCDEIKERYTRYIADADNEKALYFLNEAFAEMREAMDIFLGDGACEKIFGTTNYITMFDDLAEALQPHFEKMRVKMGTIADVIAKKYKTEDTEEDGLV